MDGERASGSNSEEALRGRLHEHAMSEAVNNMMFATVPSGSSTPSELSLLISDLTYPTAIHTFPTCCLPSDYVTIFLGTPFFSPISPPSSPYSPVI